MELGFEAMVHWVYIEMPFIGSSDDRSEVLISQKDFSQEHVHGGSTGLLMGCVRSSDVSSEVPMKELILAESILSDIRWNFGHMSEVLI